MATVEELLVKAKPEGLEETSGQFEQMQGDLDAVEDDMQDTTDQLTDLQGKWKGAMTALVGGLAAAAGGVLAQVPILGEVGSAIASVLGAVGFQIDQLLRDLGAGGFIGMLFDLSEAIFQAEGSVAGLVGAFAGMTGVAGAVLAVLSLIGVSLTGPLIAGIGIAAAAIAALAVAWENNFANIQGVTRNVMSFAQRRIQRFVQVAGPILRGFVNSTIQFWNKWGSTITGIVNFVFRTMAAIFKTQLAALLTASQFWLQVFTGDFKGAFNTLKNFLRTLGQIWGPLIDDAVQAIISAFNAGKSAVKNAVKDITGAVETKINNLVSDAKQWGKDLINEFVNGIKNNINKVRDAIKGIADEVRKRLEFNSPPDEGPLANADTYGSGLVETFSTGISANVGSVASASEDVAGAAEPEGFAAGRTIETRLFVDGREVNRGTERYRDDETSRRGAF